MTAQQETTIKQEVLRDQERPETFHMSIHSGMLETMGHNMYSSVAKCLAEFVANAYDADADKVNITMDFARIEEAKKAVREKARLEKTRKLRKDISAIYDPLPEDITITIKDDGHGMSARQIQDYFLAVTRNRREDEDGRPTRIYTESNRRKVMGRKGVGKLAGFGAAEHIKITSKRQGETYSTTFEMDYGLIKNNNDITESKFTAIYSDNLPEGEHYTVIVLSQLRCDSMKSSAETINNTLSRTFGALDSSFEIMINDEKVIEQDIEWEFTFPRGAAIDNFASDSILVDESDPDSKFEFQYIIRFRARPSDSDGQVKKRTSLPAERRGARIYAHGRLTHGPSLLELHSGVHNFHAQDYMECIVIADAIDEFDNDFIVTSREGLNNDNPVVVALFKRVTELMKNALAEHYKFRDEYITKAIKEDSFSQSMLTPIQNVNQKSKKAATEILKIIGKEHGLKSEAYMNMAPIVLQAVNAGEVLAKLIELETDPKSVQVLAHSMAELTRMERGDLLKLYRGRNRAIGALQKLHEDGNTTRKGKGFEKELHSLLKENPWLVNATYSNFLTSDRPMGDVCRELNRTLKIDDQSENDDTTRPDLVYVATNSSSCEHVVIVELKSPGIEMEQAHFLQLKRYMRKTEQHLANKMGGRVIQISGYLIGNIPPADTKTDSKLDLLHEIKQIGPKDNILVLDLLTLVTSAKQAHEAGIEALEKEEKEMDEDLS
ncbi:ATP-binding protein [Citrobacter amalonaticus]|uniref:ATP-binding protein n=1 Tax=Citrobacter amalonaticus TaxID=35703 RepID=UPI00115BC5D5|nr:ATP-binding protein [Citrobacter amalonaticus]QDK85526.1 hypothetical protein FEO47_08535 [Citrobacter amalonaticus]